MKRNFDEDYLKAVKKKNREKEFSDHGKSINYSRVQKSKKDFKRTTKRFRNIDFDEFD